MKRLITLIASGAMFSLSVSSAVADMPERTLSLTTSGAGGAWYSVGARIMGHVERAFPALTTQVQTGGGLANLEKVQRGQSDIGMTFDFAAPLAYSGRKPFEKAHDNLTYLGQLFPGYLQIVVRADSGIKDFEDLFDKRISAGNIGFGGELMFRLMLDVFDMDYDKIRRNGGVVNHVGTDQAASMMRDGNLDAIISAGSPPGHPKFAELAVTTGIDLLQISDEGLDRIFAAYPSFAEGTMPPNPYEGVAGDFRTIGGGVILIARKGLSDEAAYGVVKALYENLETMKKDDAQLREARVQDALAGMGGLPVHPGAARYFKEIGLE